MNEQFFRVSERSANKTKRPGGPLLVIASLALALTLSACNQQYAHKTAGRKLDSAIAKSEQAAKEARVKAEHSAAQAKEKNGKNFCQCGSRT
jgi:hyperosmotically inducible periplasmic protein